MLSFALTILGYGRIAANAVGAWLSRRSLAELACIALVAFALVQHFQLKDARHDRDAWHRQFDSEHAKLQAISSKRNDQKLTTDQNIKIVTKIVHDAEDKAHQVESAPPPGNCRTSPQVLGADL
jgi:hypothetical protein